MTHTKDEVETWIDEMQREPLRHMVLEPNGFYRVARCSFDPRYVAAIEKYVRPALAAEQAKLAAAAAQKRHTEEERERRRQERIAFNQELRAENRARGIPMPKQKRLLPPEQQWDATVELWQAQGYCAEDHYGVGRIVETHRLFCVGDVVLIRWSNGGGCRQPVFAVTSKGYAVDGYYLRYNESQTFWRRRSGEYRKEDRPGGPLCIIAIPGELRGVDVADPGLRRFVVSLRATTPVRRVGTCSAV